MDNGPKSRIRLKFARPREACGLTHLEQIKVLRNMVASSGLPWSPAKCGALKIPKMSFGPAISVGYESTCEYADMYLEKFVMENEAVEKLGAVRSPLKLILARRIPLFFPSIEAGVNAAEYLISARFPDGFSQKDVDGFFSAERIIYEKVKPSGTRELIDLKQLVLSASFDPAAQSVDLIIKFEPKKNVKPEIVLDLMTGGRASDGKILKKELYWIDSDGKLEVF